MAEYRPQPRSPIYQGARRRRYSKNPCGLFYCSKRRVLQPTPGMMIDNISRYLCDNDPNWAGLSNEQFQQCEAELSGILQGEHQYTQIDTANIALLGVLNVAITGGYRPTILGFQGNYLAYADYNQYGHIGETGSGIDENKVSTHLSDSRKLYNQADRSKAMSAITPGEYAEKMTSGLSEKEKEAYAEKVLPKFSPREKLQATGIKPEVSQLHHMRLR